MIKKYDEFVNEELNWLDIKKYLIYALDPFNKNIGEIKKTITVLLRKGILPIIIASCLAYHFTPEESKSLLKDIIERYDNGYDIINKEIKSAKSIVFNKISNYKNKDKIIDKINKIEIRVGNINNKSFFSSSESYTLAQFVYDIETKEVYILVDSEHIIKSDRSEIIESIAHEMLHYVDYLEGFWSKNNNLIISQSLDKRIKTDKKYAADKLFRIIYDKDYNSEHKRLKSINRSTKKLEKIHKELSVEVQKFISMYDYYTSPEEIFVRFNLLRNFMKSQNIIKRFDDNLTNKDFEITISKLKKDKNKNFLPVMYDYIIVLLLIDFESDSVNKIAKVNTDLGITYT